MAYRILDLETTAALPGVRLEGDEDGLGVLVRVGDVPTSFFLAPLRPGAELSPADVASLVHRGAGLDLTRAALRAELGPVPPPARLDLTVAVCTRDRTELLRRCLEALLRVDTGGSRVEVLVVDNAPSDGSTRQLVAGLEGVRYVCEPVPGLDHARNRAVASAGTELLAFVDDDVVVDRAWLRGLASTWAEHPDAAAVTGLVLPLELDTPAQVLFEQRGGFRRGASTVRYAQVNPYRRRHLLGAGAFGTGANMAFRVEVLRDLGGFDVALDTGPPLPGGGDLDMFSRVLAAGRVLVYAPAAAVWHRHRRDLPGLRRQYWTWGTGYLAFLHKTFRAEPRLRGPVADAALWWLRRQLVVVGRSLAGRDPAGPGMAAAPLAGGIATGAWKYPWSRRRQRGAQVRAGRSGSPAVAGSPLPPPLAIAHVRLDQPLQGLAHEPGTGGALAVLWLGDMPLGERYLDRTELPLTADQLATFAADAAARAVHHRLAHGTCQPAPLEREAAGIEAPPSTTPLADLRALLDADSTPGAGAAADDVVVIVATRDRPEALARCLESLRHLDPAPGHVVVVDNSRGATAAPVVAAHPEVELVHAPAGALATARNAGLAATRAPIVAFTDDDVVVHRRWLAPALVALRDPDVASVTGLVLPLELRTQAQVVFERTLRYLHKGYRPLRYDHAFLEATAARGAPVWQVGAGANLVLRRAAVDAVGGFDERLGAGAAGCAEDSELWHRLLAAGWICRYEPAAVVLHEHRAETAAVLAQSRAYLRGHVAGLAVQRRATGGTGEVRRALVDLPADLLAAAARDLWSGPVRRRVALARISGYVAGLGVAARDLRRP